MPAHDPEGVFISPIRLKEFLSRPIEYAAVRAKWQMMTTEEKGAYVNPSYGVIDSIRKMSILIIKNSS